MHARKQGRSLEPKTRAEDDAAVGRDGRVQTRHTSSPLRLGSFDERCEIAQWLGAFEERMLFLCVSASSHLDR